MKTYSKEGQEETRRPRKIKRMQHKKKTRRPAKKTRQEKTIKKNKRI